MEKPFELKALGAALLGELKKVAVPATGAVVDWAAQSCALTDNAIVKGIGGVLVGVKPAILAEVEKAIV